MGGQLEIQSLQKYVTDKNMPKNLVDKFDGHTLWFNIAEDGAYNKYRDIEEPHVKN